MKRLILSNPMINALMCPVYVLDGRSRSRRTPDPNWIPPRATDEALFLIWLLKRRVNSEWRDDGMTAERTQSIGKE